MVASGAEASPKVPLLAKFAKSRAPITNSVRNWQSTTGDVSNSPILRQ